MHSGTTLWFKVSRYVVDTTGLDVPNTLFNEVLLGMSLRDQERHSRYRFDKDAKSFVIGRLLPAFALSQCLHIKERPQVVSTDKGRLSFSNLPHVDFNGSHDGKYVILGVLQGSIEEGHARIGMDISRTPLDQSPQFQKDSLELLAPQFTSRERRDYLFGSSAAKCDANDIQNLHSCLRALHTLWAIKEAYLKCTGRGVDSDEAMSDLEIRHVGQIDDAEAGSDKASSRDLFAPKGSEIQWSLSERSERLLDWSITTTWLDEEHVCATVVSQGNSNVSIKPFHDIDVNHVFRWAGSRAKTLQSAG